MKTGPQSLPPVIIFLIKILSFAANHFVWPAANQLQDKDGLQIRTLGFVLVLLFLLLLLLLYTSWPQTNSNWRLIYFTAPSCGVCSLLQWNVNKLVGRKESPRHPPNVVAAASSSFVTQHYTVFMVHLPLVEVQVRCKL